MIKMNHILLLVYDIAFALGFAFYLPRYVWRKKISVSALKEKVGIIPLRYQSSIWIQVVSVGEVNLIEELIGKLRQLYDYPIVISTTTLTGNRVARKKYSSLAKVIFFPFDITIVIQRVLNRLKPKLFIAVETELWPNLFFSLKRKNIPIVIVNGRISDKAFRRYKRIKIITGQILRMVDFVGVQNRIYEQRFVSLGCAAAKISITGNLKFKSVGLSDEHLAHLKARYSKLLRQEENTVLIGGSTHNLEEEMLLDVYRQMVNCGCSVSLIIAPRHIERTPQIEKIISSYGFRPVRLSSMEGYVPGERCVFLLDTVGELAYFYSLSDVCFVGGSLIQHGGQNILEPISLLKPTCFGPFMGNFKDIEDIVLEQDAAIKVKDVSQLKEELFRLVSDEALRNRLRLNCLKVFEDEKLSLEQNLELILRCLK